MIEIQDLIDKLARKIHRSGFSAAAVCQQAGIQHASWCRWKAGQQEPRLSSLNKLEAAIVELQQKELV